MNFSFKRKNYGDMTPSEKRLSDYITQNARSVIEDSAQSLAKKADVSPATVVRFSQNLGYKGFPELKMGIMADLSNDVELDDGFSENIEAQDTLHDLLRKTKASDLDNVNQTYQLLDEEQLLGAIRTLKNANRVALFGVGGSSIPCLDLSQKLMRIDKNVIYSADLQMEMTACSYLNENDVALFVSYSGRTKEIVKAAEILKAQKVPLIVVTQSMKSPLHKLADFVIYVPTQENDLRLGAVASRNASLILTDLLYLGVIKEDLPVFKDKLILTKNVVRQFNA